MLAFLLAPLYFLINWYVLRLAMRWMGACHKYFQSKWFCRGFVGAYLFMALTPLTSFIVHKGVLHRLLKLLNNYWLGIFLYTLLVLLGAGLTRILLKRTKRISQDFLEYRKTFAAAGGICVFLITLLSIYGIFHARYIHTAKYEVEIQKECRGREDLRIIVAGDLHLGYSVGEEQMRRMVEAINACDGDLVCLTGDIFDNEYNAISHPERIASVLREIKSTYGVYACWGNHDLNEKLLAGFSFPSGEVRKEDPRMKEFLEAADITLLSDEVLLVDDAFCLAGRKDPSMVKKMRESRESPEELLGDLNKDIPVIVMDHQPSQLEELAEAGADLDLSGHTHDGQMFPGNLTVRLGWKNPCGLLQVGDMTSIVTSGVGVWGPAMRVGTESEIVEILVHFTENP